ncbi:MAG: DUF1343 domain-containing protein [Prevotella sp.]|jgi:uncharacterized protein YbbC (DUF1343 family)|nr:DUF1343 domain-containing protein [Prevotella sp.]
MKRLNITFILFILFIVSQAQNSIKTGAESTDEYFSLIRGKRIAVMSNHTGMVNNEHLVDMLVKEKVNVVAIFSPEHGFRGNADAGEHVAGSVDEKTSIPIRSLYDGKDGKPGKESMEMFDILIIDIQDVGLRFYTYYITMVKLMDVCAGYGKKVIVLDRPNPNGHYIDGPILDMKHKSGVGWLPIPIVHGMTLGELALMVNGEKWLTDDKTCDLTVIKCKNYTHKMLYKLPVAPSPNLPTMKSVYLYPSTCLFEATPVSLGRGTSFPFEVYGHPNMKGYTFSFTPRSISGAKNPPQLNKLCYGVDLRNMPDDEIFAKGFDLTYIIDAYNNLNMGDHFFRSFFEKLVGVDYIRKMIIDGKSAGEIKKMWKGDVEKFRLQRKPYLLYEE